MKEKNNIESYRSLSLDGCNIVGKGAKSTVYSHENEMIVKVYNKDYRLSDIVKERKLAKKALKLGIPTAIPYDIVKVGNQFGTVFQMLDAMSISELLVEHPENTDLYIKSYIGLLKKIHSIVVNDSEIPDIRIFVKTWIKNAAPYLLQGEAEQIGNLVDTLPLKNNMLHCDYHTNNVMLNKNGEALIIDMDTLSYGHPVFELANIYYTFVGYGVAEHTIVENFLNIPYSMTVDFWKKFLLGYMGGASADLYEAVEEKAKLIAFVRLLSVYSTEGLMSKAMQKTADICKNEITILLRRVKSLDFA